MGFMTMLRWARRAAVVFAVVGVVLFVRDPVAVFGALLAAFGALVGERRGKAPRRESGRGSARRSEAREGSSEERKRGGGPTAPRRRRR